LQLLQGAIMKSRDVEIGCYYKAKVSGAIVTVKIVGSAAGVYQSSTGAKGGWTAINMETNRHVHIRTAARLRSKVLTDADRSQLVRDRNTWLASALSGAAWCLYGARLNPSKRSARLCVEVAS
jgi:hypothetical protein